MPVSKKTAAVTQGCVACGCCVKVCPIGAIAVYKGMYALVSGDICVGCGKCAAACPAAVIEIVFREGEILGEAGKAEKKLA